MSSLLEPDLVFDADDTELFLRTIDTEADRLDRVIGNLLDMGRVQTDAITALTRPTALEEVVSAALCNLGVHDQVHVDVEPTLPLVEIDGALLERALANVVANTLAVQAPGRPVRFDAARIITAGADWLLLRVVDNGPGIAPADRHAATAPFQRLGDRSTQAGVGLGLAIAVGFSRAIGAELELDDTPGGGLTVTFRLPLAAPRAADRHPDVVLLDLGLPGIDDIEVIEGLRGWTDIPIIVLSVRGEESDKIGALDAGADDYVSKPFGMGELLARMRSALRRTRPEAADPVVRTTHSEVDLAAKRVTDGAGADVRLTQIEWSIVELLVRNPGRLVSQRQLLHEVWGPQYGDAANYLRVHLANVRRKLEPSPSTPRYFITEVGMGYRFEPAQSA